MFFHVRASFLQLKDVIRSGTLLYGVPIRISLLFWKLLTIGIQLWQFVELNGQTMNWAKSELYRKWIWGENFLRRLFHYGLS